MSKKLQNNLKRILEFIGETEKEAANIFVEDKRIAENLKIDIQEVQDHLDILEDGGKIQLAKAFGPTFGALLTAEGRMSLRYPDHTQANGKKSIMSKLDSFDRIVNVVIRTGKRIWYLISSLFA